MYLCSLRLPIDRRHVDPHAGMVLLHQLDPFRRRDDADHADVAGAGLRAGGRAPPRRCRRSPASDRSSGRRCCRAPSGASSSTATRSRCSRRAGGRCGRPARPESAPGSRRACPSPARSTGTTTTSADTRRPSAGAERRLDRDRRRRQVARRFGRQQQADPDGHPAEELRRRPRVAQRRRARRARADVRRRGRTRAHYTLANRDWRMSDRRMPMRDGIEFELPMLRDVAAAGGRRGVAGGSPGPSASHGVARRRQRHRGHGRRQPARASRAARSPSTAATSSAVDTAEAIAAAVSRPRDDRRRGRGRHARPGQHAHPCADGPLPRPRRRPGADGLAAEVHLPGRGEDRVAGVRPRRHAAGRARDDRVGHDHLRRHVLLRGGDRPRHEGGRACAASSARRSSSFPVAGREDAGRRPGPGGAVREGVRRRRADHRRRSRRTRCTRTTPTR